MLSTGEDEDQSLCNDTTFLPPENTDKAVRTPVTVLGDEPG